MLIQFVCMNLGKLLLFRQIIHVHRSFQLQLNSCCGSGIFIMLFGAAASLLLRLLIPQSPSVTWETNHETWRIKKEDPWKLANIPVHCWSSIWVTHLNASLSNSSQSCPGFRGWIAGWARSPTWSWKYLWTLRSAWIRHTSAHQTSFQIFMGRELLGESWQTQTPSFWNM